ncbi:4-hydroxy-3-methylbut-2-en-1-yl diphosphate synthase [Candidatus Curtissbacteria bacterium RIFCSPLOWO2_01_FULL_39_62]|uniref:4-hydroxy-3-methylbut-2-en-1-yl diphosphate synthase (flavodoxin) n=2 Tax=Candidatus Curtissiibacteriota TaxID=1752717 RepID=A0A1F5GA81_9BACT|nr:MAG: 4-hydroxy-3-methylbut-2-en-1-yl diphosphate synthase [Candidatus Curtissbacteria bacterium RIFCSPHIGHO2_01_FULL_39_57]OGD88756.1 MAG: 4-hydroxy-3-methylbut-2-en-1-yl diphosphate synthase [Candidatus Curtissbacteria bacterium RIFCSPHIGHO2_02_FULL_40_16b]OGD89896.1 MAG: 4-hydroxy-3-methylbut-2-en-1-yl diphosphate synthase [Candidatus Curtissbacteria bacterium RIFCSPHIGHO2_12_FULL_38_37]OGD99194.1 MAG: 4-hydroxy-3-methylbut-2-en-1-yl diphosphate synthase [Candidatus Curtissbacteria bacteriu
MERRQTKEIGIGSLKIGGDKPIAVQSMAATHTQDIEATLQQVQLLEKAGASLVRIAADSIKDVEALAEIRAQTVVPLSVDLQENWRLAKLVVPYVDKIRYNPGHLWHHEKQMSTREKVAFIAEQAEKHDCALRVGVNCGSVDPEVANRFDPSDSISPIVASALEHSEILDKLGFTRYCVSLKDSDPKKVVEANKRFAKLRPDVPIHLGVTEAGMPLGGIMKTRLAFEQLIPIGIGDTIRVSLTLPFEEKGEEIHVGREILEKIEAGEFLSLSEIQDGGLNIISCPSCSRVENEAFVELAQSVRELTEFAKDNNITIAVMGCRVNGPGETDDADLGLWCGPTHVNLKRGPELVGQFTYNEVLIRLKDEVERLIELH